jgi:hypothetical protein
MRARCRETIPQPALPVWSHTRRLAGYARVSRVTTHSRSSEENSGSHFEAIRERTPALVAPRLMAEPKVVRPEFRLQRDVRFR